MPAMLQYTTEERRCCAVFLWAKGLNAKDIHKEMCPVYGGKCLSRKAVHDWVEKFSQGCSKVAEDARPGEEVAEAAVHKASMLRVYTHW
jgi:transposase